MSDIDILAEAAKEEDEDKDKYEKFTDNDYAVGEVAYNAYYTESGLKADPWADQPLDTQKIWAGVANTVLANLTPKRESKAEHPAIDTLRVTFADGLELKAGDRINFSTRYLEITAVGDGTIVGFTYDFDTDPPFRVMLKSVTLVKDSAPLPTGYALRRDEISL